MTTIAPPTMAPVKVPTNTDFQIEVLRTVACALDQTGYGKIAASLDAVRVGMLRADEPHCAVCLGTGIGISHSGDRFKCGCGRASDTSPVKAGGYAVQPDGWTPEKGKLVNPPEVSLRAERDRAVADVALYRAMLRTIFMTLDGERHAVTPDNAFAAFERVNKILVTVREQIKVVVGDNQ